MTKEQEQVAEFMCDFGQEVNNSPTWPSDKIRLLRAKLIFEEAMEVIKALGFKLDTKFNDEPTLVETGESCSLVDVADGLADLHYVAYCGTGVACGLDMEKIFERVHASNMSKFWTIADFPFKPKDCIVTPIGAYFFKVTNADGKVIKPPSFQPPKLADLCATNQPTNTQD